ncbi:MAG: bifunctional glutamate N-acetyltransferase/amino-acid acetyltransferase ArgJ [Candidatus Micrarchaeota archaeon]
MSNISSVSNITDTPRISDTSLRSTTSITSVNGFSALSKHIGIKKTKLDFGVIYSDTLCNAAAVYTQNKIKGAPLYVNMEHLKDGKAQAIVINSGIANVCTGKKGIKDAKTIARLTAKEMNIKETNVLVASTGLIGCYLPMDKIKKGLVGIRSVLSKKSKIAEAILTTDKVKKEVLIKKDNFSIGAIAKGAGMIYPNMATMLAFLCTDAEIQSHSLKKMLKNAVDISFNMLAVDMDTSTSDMCIIMANGKAGKVNEKIFQKALNEVCIELSKKIACDGEGATKLIEVHVKSANNEKCARMLAKSVVSSNLVKCAVYGNDPNWGRILCALGNSKVDFDETKISVRFENLEIVKHGVSANFDRKKASEIMNRKNLKIIIEMNCGTASATAYGCDMGTDYIKINACYHT